MPPPQLVPVPPVIALLYSVVVLLLTGASAVLLPCADVLPGCSKISNDGVLQISHYLLYFSILHYLRSSAYLFCSQSINKLASLLFKGFEIVQCFFVAIFGSGQFPL